VFDRAESASAPDLLNAEVLQILRQHERRSLIDASRSRLALETLTNLPITRYPTLNLLDRAWGLRHNLTAYDAMHAALALALGVSLVTADGRLAAAARDHVRVSVVLLSESTRQ
jgi:predicted nucleic acid-binding protein